MRIKFILSTLFYSLLLCVLANSFLWIRSWPPILVLLIPTFLFIYLFAGGAIIKTQSKRIRICSHGAVLLGAFYVSLIVSAAFHITLAILTVTYSSIFWWNILFCICVLAVVFWNGIICVYLTSTQLGMKLRVIGIICGLVPVVNLIVLYVMIHTTIEECLLEAKKERLNLQRKDEKICATKYPILLVHGVFFRDSKVFNYWGRIPKELERNGAKIFYGRHPSAASVADCAAEIKERIEQILAKSGAEKVNIIAHSKGGLDCRYAIAKLGIAHRVASLTTINTPHRGCLFADALLAKVPPHIQSKIANTYNSAMDYLGEEDPDFLTAVNDLTDAKCQLRDADMPFPDGIYCHSIGSVMKNARSGAFPLNLSYRLVHRYSGENDGLVDEPSFRWGENYTLLRPTTKRGISHADIIDLTRKNIPGFDVREFYVELVKDLKARGL